MKDEIVIYQPNETFQLEVHVQDDSVWLNRQQMALLFDRDVKTIGKHIKNALQEELKPVVANFATTQNVKENPVVSIFATTAADGKTYQVEYYNLDLSRHNQQYPNIDVHEFGLSHDRFLIIDNTVYHIGASLKDLGKRWFAFSKMDDITAELLINRLTNQ